MTDNMENCEQAKLICQVMSTCIEKEFSVCLRCILRFSNVKQLFLEYDSSKLEVGIHSCFEQDENVLKKLEQLKRVRHSSICYSCFDLLADSFIEDHCQHVFTTLSNHNLVDFRLHITLPVVFTVRNLYFAKLFKLNASDFLNPKDFFRSLLVSRLETVLGAKQNLDSNFIIELNFPLEYGHEECQNLVETYPDLFFSKRCCKSLNKSFINNSSVARVFNEIAEEQLGNYKLNLIHERCSLASVTIRHEPVLIAGRYLKFSRKLSQTPWFLNSSMSSVQEKIVESISKFIKFSNVKFSSSGREDVDVRMLGKGRPFLIEIINPEFPSTDDLASCIQQHLNASHQDIQVRDLQFVDKQQSHIIVKEGEQEKTKVYQALCCLNRSVTEKDFQILNGTVDLKITQKTPIRVLHRRSLSDRVRLIHRMWTEPVEVDEIDDQFKSFKDQIFKLNLETEAGTYIKEFVHSDFGRTCPNLAMLLGDCQADILTLDVLEVKVNWPPQID